MKRAASISSPENNAIEVGVNGPPSDRARRGKWIGPILFVGVMIMFVLWSVWFISRTSFLGIDGRRYFSLFDDAMVSMRYAWNLSHGNGLVWNIGERVEGYTNLLQTLVMAMFAIFLDKPGAVLAVQVTGAIVMVFNGLLAVAVSRHIELGQWEAHRRTFEFLALIGVLWYYPLAYWSLMGMETGLLTGLTLLGVLLAFRIWEKGGSREVAGLSLVLGLAFLTRPDSAVVSVVILAYALVGLTKAGSWRRSLRLGIAATLLFALLPIGQFLFRLSYYDNFWPNTYYLKIEGFPLTQRIRNGWAFMAPFFKENWLFLGLAGLSVARRSTKERLLFLVLGMTLVGYQIFVGGDAWRLWRMASPGMPFLLLLFLDELIDLTGNGAKLLSDRWRSRQADGPPPSSQFGGTTKAAEGRTRLVAAALGIAGLAAAGFGILSVAANPDEARLGIDQRAVLVWVALLVAVLAALALSRAIGGKPVSLVTSCLCLAFFVGLGSLNARFLPELLGLSPPYQVDENKANVDVAIALLDTTTDMASVGVIWAGAIPFYSERYAIDFLGKTDAHIAHLLPELGGASRRGSMLTWPGHNKYDLEYSIGSLMPTYVQVFDWGRQHMTQLRGEAYEHVAYRGVSLWLLRDSPAVLWSELAQADS